MADSKKYDGSQWEHSLRKQTTASEIIVPPTTIYADGTAISTYSIKGNTVQDGVPTPSNPIYPQGCGDLVTEGEHAGQYKIPISSGGVTTNIYTTEPLMKISDSVDSKSNTTETRAIRKYVITGQENVDYTLYSGKNMFSVYNAFDTTRNLSKTGVCSHYIFQWLNDYGYAYIANSCDKICIFDENYDNASDFKAYLQQQYANGTPVTIYYVRATPTTESVTAPTIPTTEGANTITVDTTVQPSEFTASWTGWHNAYVKEKSENLFDETYPNIDSSLHYLAINVGNGDFILSTTCPRNQSGACLFFLAGNVSSGASTENNGIWGYSGTSYGTMRRTQTAVNGYVTIAYRSLTTELNPVNEDTILNSGSTALPYAPYWK